MNAFLVQRMDSIKMRTTLDYVVQPIGWGWKWRQEEKKRFAKGCSTCSRDRLCEMLVFLRDGGGEWLPGTWTGCISIWNRKIAWESHPRIILITILHTLMTRYACIHSNSLKSTDGGQLSASHTVRGPADSAVNKRGTIPTFPKLPVKCVRRSRGRQQSNIKVFVTRDSLWETL